MENILDIPKIYTANAEWMACLTTILVYRRCIPQSARKRLLAAAEMALTYVAIRAIQYFCQQHDGIVWLAAMACAVLVIVAAIRTVLQIKWDMALYMGARTFMWAELAAAIEWQVYHYHTFGHGVQPGAAFGMAASVISYYATADMPISMVAGCSGYETYQSGKYIPSIMGILFSLEDVFDSYK